MDRYIGHRKVVTLATRDLGFPDGLPQLVADYACVSDEERLRQMFQTTDEVQFIGNGGRYEILCVRNVRAGIEVCFILTLGLRNNMSYSRFIDELNSGTIDTHILKNLNCNSPDFEMCQLLLKGLVDYWRSM